MSKKTGMNKFSGPKEAPLRKVGAHVNSMSTCSAVEQGLRSPANGYEINRNCLIPRTGSMMGGLATRKVK